MSGVTRKGKITGPREGKAGPRTGRIRETTSGREKVIPGIIKPWGEEDEGKMKGRVCRREELYQCNQCNVVSIM